MTSRIKPRDPRLLTELDVAYGPFHCCGNEELVFLKCPACAHLMVFCYECDTLYPDLHDLGQSVPVSLTRLEHRLTCPVCRRPFADFHFLMPPNVDRYLATADDVIAAGFAELLSDERRRALGLKWMRDAGQGPPDASPA